MNRNKSRFVTLVFSCFFAIFVVGNAFAVSCTSSQYVTSSGHYCRSCDEVGPSSAAYTCKNNYVTCKSGYVKTFSRIYLYSSSGSLEAEYCCPSAQAYTDAGGTYRCLTQWSGYYSNKQGTEYDNGATVSGGTYTCPSGYTRVMKPFAGYADTSGGSGKVKYDTPQYACCLTANTYLGPDGTTKFCADDGTNLHYTRNDLSAFIEEKSNGTKEFKCLATGWTNYGNRNFRAAIMNRDYLNTPNVFSYWDCQSVLYSSNVPCSESYSPSGINCNSGNFTVNCYSPKTNSSGKVTGYNYNKAGYAMDGTSFRGCEVNVTITGKTGCTDNQVVYHYDLNTSGSYAPSTILYNSTRYDTVVGTFFDIYSVETAEWLVKGYTFTAQGGYRKNTSNGTCVQCSAGTYSAGGNVTACANCYGGKYGTTAGATSCNGTCAKGTYSDWSGPKTSCTACTGATYAPNTGMDKCLDVPYNASVNSAHDDISCQAGYYKSTNRYSGEPWYFCPPCPRHYGNSCPWTVDEMASTYNGTTDSSGATSITQCKASMVLTDSKGTYTQSATYSGDDYVTIGLDTNGWGQVANNLGGVQNLVPTFYGMCAQGYFPWSGIEDYPDNGVSALLDYQWVVGSNGTWNYLYVPMGIAQIIYRDLTYAGYSDLFTYYDY
ncbi:MAG: hypothetical protein IKP05_03385 [Alphaproteobacteria bacterium]|nr:hypothetical protein [Alphaproteobacteria bacterium]